MFLWIDWSSRIKETHDRIVNRNLGSWYTNLGKLTARQKFNRNSIVRRSPWLRDACYGTRMLKKETLYMSEVQPGSIMTRSATPEEPFAARRAVVARARIL